MQRMLAQRQAVATSASISAAVEGYHAFLRQMRLQPSGLEPSALRGEASQISNYKIQSRWE